MNIRKYLGAVTATEVEKIVDKKLAYAKVSESQLRRLRETIDGENKHKYNALNQRVTKLEAKGAKTTKRGK